MEHLVKGLEGAFVPQAPDGGRRVAADLIVKRVEAGRKWHQRPYSMIVLDGLGRYLPEREGMLTTGGDPVSTALALDRVAVRTEAAVLAVLRDDQAERLQLPVDAEIALAPGDDGTTEIRTASIHYPTHPTHPSDSARHACLFPTRSRHQRDGRRGENNHHTIRMTS